MSEDTSKVEFTFGWLAMKLLGKSLYSNAWSAISELVANGFDANADTVFLYINVKNKENSVIEIFDNGTGMTEKEIKTYTQVGYNKRTDPNIKARLPMGRKGIGKLAALYLSNNYSIITKVGDGSKNAWQMHYTEVEEKINEKPFLEPLDASIEITCSEYWDQFKTGTLLKLTNVNLEGKGNAAFNGLEQKLANYFSLSSTNKKIMLCIDSDNNIEFKQIQKTIAFGNMAFIEYSSVDKLNLEKKLKAIRNTQLSKPLKIPYSKQINNQAFYYTSTNITELEKDITHGTYSYMPQSDKIDNDEQSSEITTEEHEQEKEKKKKKKDYTLKGWIGIHSSIKKEVAEENDNNFKKNQFYNPNQLRVYVRNKLAIENFLNVINNTQAFVNYIEGEIHFDILDDDDLPDIATSNRQSMNEHDERIILLKGIVDQIIQSLISKRHKLSEEMKKQQGEIEEKYNESAKQQFTQELEIEVEDFQMPEEKKADFIRTISNKIKGDMIKNDYMVFLSHARKNKKFTDFLYKLLLQRGAEVDEFFYTSKELNPKEYNELTTLGERIKKNIVKTNTLLFYLTSKDYKCNEFCMFEGGAGWATRSVGDYIIWTLDYEDIPKFLTNGKLEFVINQGLNEDTYIFLVSTLNKIIEHLNSGRRLKNKNEIVLFSKILTFPDKVQLQQENKTVFDYMDPLIKEYWNAYIENIHVQ